VIRFPRCRTPVACANDGFAGASGCVNRRKYGRVSPSAIFTLVVTVVAASVAAQDARLPVRIETVNGETIAGDLQSIAPDGEVKYQASNGGATIRLEDVAAITPRPVAAGGVSMATSRPDSGGPLSYVLFLADGGRLAARLLPPASDAPASSVTVDAGLGDAWTLPLAALAGIRFSSTPTMIPEREYQARLTAREVARDFLIADRTERPVVLGGALESLRPDALEFRFGQQLRTVKPAQAYAVVLGAGPSAPRPGRVQVLLHGEGAFTGDIVSADAARLALNVFGVGQRHIRWADVRRLDLQSRRVQYLADLNPATADTRSLLEVDWPVRAGRNVVGGPLKLDGKTYERGLGVHAVTTLTYKLDEDFERFRAMVGVDDGVAPHGSVVFRVLGDGRKLFESGVLRGGRPPVEVSVDVSGVKVLTLQADAADEFDVSDHADWAEARLIRAAAPAAKGAAQ